MKDTTYKPWISFPDQSHSFVHGYEAGMIGERMESGKEVFEMNIHKENEALVRDMCGKYCYNFTLSEMPGFEEYLFLVCFKNKSTDN